MSNIFGTTASAAQPQAPQTAEELIASLTTTASSGTSSSSTSSKAGKADRKPSEYWLNVGMVLPGAGENGEDIFLSMTGGGIALDDLHAAEVRGSSPRWVQMQQGKNTLLELVQRAAAGLTPGSRAIVPKFVCEVSRVGKPEQTADANNPFSSAIRDALKGE